MIATAAVAKIFAHSHFGALVFPSAAGAAPGSGLSVIAPPGSRKTSRQLAEYAPRWQSQKRRSAWERCFYAARIIYFDDIFAGERRDEMSRQLMVTGCIR